MATKRTVYISGGAIEATVTDKAAAVHEWVRDTLSPYGARPMVVGLDCEWNCNSMTNKAATLHLCFGIKCLIIQLLYLDYIPQSIKDFFCDSNVTFVGVEIGADVQAQRQLAMERWPSKFYQKPGLKTLAYEVVGLAMEKPMHVCSSNWEARILDVKQIEYACIDAYACYRIGHKLLRGN
ncbi:hypothetical protein NMG60_11035136 [Bertholletia excelsa]